MPYQGMRGVRVSCSLRKLLEERLTFLINYLYNGRCLDRRQVGPLPGLALQGGLLALARQLQGGLLGLGLGEGNVPGHLAVRPAGDHEDKTWWSCSGSLRLHLR